jgi:hypothetical protein
MARRTTRVEKWKYFEHPLTTAQTAEKGEVACIDTATGFLAIAAAGVGTLRPIGHFDDGDSTITGDQVTKVRVRLFDEITVHWLDNNGGDTVLAADVGGLCYLLGVSEVGRTAGTNSVAGRVWALNTQYGVAVEMRGFDDAGA